MDKNKARMLFKEIQAAVEAVSSKHKCRLTTSNPRSNHAMVRFKIEVTDLDAAPVPGHQASTDFPNGHTFMFLNRTYKVNGSRPGRDFNWVLAERQPDGKQFRFRPSDIPGAKPKVKRPESEILEALRDVESGLSPENLSCDGIASRAHINQTYRRLMMEKRALVAELGREPTDKELYNID